VLVNGASGGVGSYAVQLLRQRGATVVATGTAADADRLRGLGAATVVDFTAGPVAEQVRAAYADGVDALVNLAGFTADDVPLAAVRAGGRVSTTTGAPDVDALTARGLTGSGVMASPTSEVTGPLVEQAAAGTLEVQVDTVLPFERAAEGLATLAAGQAHGKIVVTIGSEA
jgi:NADPH:quinone reductase-like Zn-dependent oxidoreductase